MIIFQLILLLAVLLFPLPNGELKKDCKFITCRDCATMDCVWIIYFTKAQACVASAKSLPGVESQVDDPNDCAHPTCVMPPDEHWDATGLAQLFGGIFGGLVAGMCGAAGIQSCRRGRNQGYQELGGGRRPWMEFARAFFATLFNRIRRADEEAFLHGDDEEDEALRQQAIRRNALRNAQARRDAQAPCQAPAQVEIPQAEPNQIEVPEVQQNPPQADEENEGALGDSDDNEHSDGSDASDATEANGAGDDRAADANVVEDEGAPGSNVVVDEGAAGSNVIEDGETTEDYSTGNEGADDSDGVEDHAVDEARDIVDGDGDDDTTDDLEHEQPGVSPLVQECASVRRSVRQAAVKARENIKKWKSVGKI